jgi:hypothetical protein
MKKQSIDYLHYYLGCEVFICYNLEGDPVIEKLDARHLFDEHDAPVGIQPILRPLSDMSDEEAEEYNSIMYTCFNAVNKFHDQVLTEAACTQYLLSRGFDLFNLIHKGLAVDKKSLE